MYYYNGFTYRSAPLLYAPICDLRFFMSPLYPTCSLQEVGNNANFKEFIHKIRHKDL